LLWLESTLLRAFVVVFGGVPLLPSLSACSISRCRRASLLPAPAVVASVALHGSLLQLHQLVPSHGAVLSHVTV